MGVVRAIMSRMASVAFPDGQEVDVACHYVEPTRPNKYDKVRIQSNLFVSVHDWCCVCR